MTTAVASSPPERSFSRIAAAISPGGCVGVVRALSRRPSSDTPSLSKISRSPRPRDSRSVTSRQLCGIYRDWCSDNSFNPLADKSFLMAFREASVDQQVLPTNNIPIGNGKKARGYKGIRPCSRF